MSTHTPTPWTTHRHAEGVDLIGPDLGFTIGEIFADPAANAEANAAHIVKCVNAHDELVAALMALRNCKLYPASADHDAANRMMHAALAKVQS
jgi:hypothetical protein